MTVSPVSLFATLLACSLLRPDVVTEALPGIDRPRALETELREALSDPDARWVNRLARSESPYLRDHAANPVDWYEWGEEPFASARADERLVFLSIGYATCHWCHVMAHESFEDEEIAGTLNAHFVAIKVDREQRPDVDEVYMDAVHLFGGRGGWPLTAILTPDGEPVFATTYLPARDGDRGSRRGLLSILEEVHTLWERDPEILRESARAVTARLVRDAQPTPPGDLPDLEVVARTIDALVASHDPQHGGFGRAPKFPVPLKLDVLLDAAGRRDDDALRDVVVHALAAMARGGIHDPIEGGFHRYSTDEAWRVPHFEKMLYDNAQLLSTYARATAVTGRPDFAWVTARTAEFLTTHLATDEGTFVAALDAGSPGPDGAPEEGLYYTFTPREVREALPAAEVPFALAHFDITATGHLEGRSVPSLVEATAPPWSDPRARTIREALNVARSQRPPPTRDDQVVLAWNALAISGLVDAHRVLGGTRWLDAALAAARGLFEGAESPEHRLARLPGGPPAMLEDEANVAVAALDLFGATGDPHWVRVAAARLAVIERHYADPAGGWFRTPDDGEPLLRRPRPRFEGAEPSGTASAIEATLRLGHLTNASVEPADRALRAYAQPLERAPWALPGVVAQLVRRHAARTEIVVTWPDEADPGPLLAVLARTDDPTAAVVTGPASMLAHATVVPWLEGKAPRDDQPTAYVCENGTCQFPVTTAAGLAEALAARTRSPE